MNNSAGERKLLYCTNDNRVKNDGETPFLNSDTNGTIRQRNTVLMGGSREQNKKQNYWSVEGRL